MPELGVFPEDIDSLPHGKLERPPYMGGTLAPGEVVIQKVPGLMYLVGIDLFHPLLFFSLKEWP